MNTMKHILMMTYISVAAVSQAATVKMATEDFVTNKVYSVDVKATAAVNGLTDVSNQVLIASNYAVRASGAASNYVDTSCMNISNMVLSVSNDLVTVSNMVADTGNNFTNYVKSGRYPMFIIEMNEFSYRTNLSPIAWSYVQIYAATNKNNLTQRIFDCDTSSVSSDDIMIFLNDLPAGLLKRYRNMSSYEGYNDRVSQIVLLIDPSSIEDNGWLNENNEDLIWFFSRYTWEDVAEVSSNQVWRTISPVRWYTRLPEWANQALPQQ